MAAEVMPSSGVDGTVDGPPGCWPIGVSETVWWPSGSALFACPSDGWGSSRPGTTRSSFSGCRSSSRWSPATEWWKPSERVPRTQARLMELRSRRGWTSTSSRSVPRTGRPRRRGGSGSRPRRLHRLDRGGATGGRDQTRSQHPRALRLRLRGGDARRRPRAGGEGRLGRAHDQPRPDVHGAETVLVHTSLASRFTEALVPLAAGVATLARGRRGGPTPSRTDAVRRGETGDPRPGCGRRRAGRRLGSCTGGWTVPSTPRRSPPSTWPADATHRWSTEDELLALHRQGGKQLATSVFTADPARVDLLRELGGGMVNVNDAIVPFAHPERRSRWTRADGA